MSRTRSASGALAVAMLVTASCASAGSVARVDPPPDVEPVTEETAAVEEASGPQATEEIVPEETAAAVETEATATGEVVPEETAAAVETEATVAYGDEPDQFGFLTVPSTATEVPVVVLVHGGFWLEPFDLSLMDRLVGDLAPRGYAVWNIEYRRVGDGGAGGWPETGDDVAAAIDHLAALASIYPLDLQRVVLVGHSAGGHLALWSLKRPDAAVAPVGVVGLGPIVDPALFTEAEALFGASPQEAPEAYAAATPDFDSNRMVLVQGENDRIVPLVTLETAEEAGVEVVLIDDENHFDLIDPASQSWAATVELIEQYVG